MKRNENESRKNEEEEKRKKKDRNNQEPEIVFVIMIMERIKGIETDWKVVDRGINCNDEWNTGVSC